MKCLVIVCLLFVVLVSLFGNTNAECEWNGRKLQIGENYQEEGECMQQTCIGDGMVIGKICPEAHAPSTCKRIPQDNSKPYPACCPSFEC